MIKNLFYSINEQFQNKTKKTYFLLLILFYPMLIQISIFKAFRSAKVGFFIQM